MLAVGDRRNALAALMPLLLCLGFLAPSRAQAGCGCDHPPPAWTVVMPPFASPGKIITLWNDGFDFVVSAAYTVEFGNKEKATTIAERTDRIHLEVPPLAHVGPAALKVVGPSLEHTYPSSAFTVLPKAPTIPAYSAAFLASIRAAVTTDGTLLVPFDLTGVLEATQFAFVFRNLPLAFGADDAVFYNSDGVDLTLFTLAVADPTQRQWGSYFGIDVQQDTGLWGTVYDKKAKKSKKKAQESDILTYWRHEFYTYSAAHAPGGSHEVDANGFHPDGTLHIDHDHLVLAISGLKRDPVDPDDPVKLTPLKPGSVDVELVLLAVQSPNPIEPADMVLILEQNPSVENITVY